MMHHFIEDVVSIVTLLGLGYVILVWGAIGEALAGV